MKEPENLKKSFEMKKIGVLMGGISAERELLHMLWKYNITSSIDPDVTV